MVLNVHRNTRLIKDREKGERETVYLSLHCHHHNDSCIKVASDESHFNVHNCEGQSHRTVSSTDHNF